MNIEYIQEICKKLPHVTEDVKWGHDLCFLIGGKMFAVTGLDEVPVTVSFKVPEDEFDDIITGEWFQPAPYMARYKWVLLTDVSKVSKTALQELLHQSYQLVASALPKKKQKELGLL